MLLGSSAEAALISRGGGLVYDSDQDITWLADANLAATNAFGVAGITVSGTLPWDVANAWIAAMNAATYLGYDDWRLPTLADPNASCSAAACPGNEMGHLYHVDGVTPGSPGPFANLMVDFYWSGTEFNSGSANSVYFGTGSASINAMPNQFRAWAVRDGDVPSVPEPNTAWLLGAGSLGLAGRCVGWRRRGSSDRRRT